MPAKITDTDLIINRDGSVYHLNLKPKHVADTVIAVGDPNRVHRITQHFDRVEYEMNKREFITHVGRYKGKKLTVISSGMGTDNVELLMTELDALVNIDLKKREPKAKRRKLNIVRIGTSASIQEDIRLGTHVMSEYAIGMDTLMSFYQLPQTDLEKIISEKFQKSIGLPFTPYCIGASEKMIKQFKGIAQPGNTVTCPGFYAPQGRTIRTDIQFPEIINDFAYFHEDMFWLTNLEMETAGYYAMGRLLGHEVISMNAIIANRVRNRFSKNPNRIIDSLIKKVLDRVAVIS